MDLGVTNAVPAAAASIYALSTELTLTRAAALDNPTGAMSPASAPNLDCSITFNDPSAVCCLDTLWPFISAVQLQQPLEEVKLQLQQPLSSGDNSAKSAGSQEKHMNPSDTPHLGAYLQGSAFDRIHESAAAAAAAAVAPEPRQVPEQAGSSAAKQEPYLELHCTVQAQTAGAATLELVSGAGELQLACGLDSAAVSARLQPDLAAASAHASLDVSVQAAVKVCPACA